MSHTKKKLHFCNVDIRNKVMKKLILYDLVLYYRLTKYAILYFMNYLDHFSVFNLGYRLILATL